MTMVDAIPLAIAAAPTVCHSITIGLTRITGWDNGPREADGAAVRDVIIALVGQILGNWLLRFIYVDATWTFSGIILGMFILDTCEYWVHRAMHSNKWVYRHSHQTHHMPPVCAVLALYNSAAEALPFSAILTLSFWFSGISWVDFIIVTTLGNIKTAWDHASTRKGHHHQLHHMKAQCNFEQPFCDVWDRLMGTRMWPEDFEKKYGKTEQ